jgi:hypothetical protein
MIEPKNCKMIQEGFYLQGYSINTSYVNIMDEDANRRTMFYY